MAHTNAIEITISDVKAFKQCRRAWDYKSNLRQNLVPKARAAHFFFGDMFHQALEKFYGGEENPDVWFKENANQFLKTLDKSETPNFDLLVEDALMGPPLLRLYKQWSREVDDFRVVDTEKRLTHKINSLVPGHFFSFKYDQLVVRNNGLWIHDFKTTKQLPSNFDWLVFDDQAVAYQWAYEQVTGQRIEGVIYSFIRKKLPTVPRQILNGELSKAKNIITTVEAYTTEIRKHGLSIGDYREHLEGIEQRQFGDFFARAEARATRAQKDIIGNQIRDIAQMMADPDLNLYPSPDRMRCVACDYRDPCVLKSAGHSDAAILATQYKQGEPRE